MIVGYFVNLAPVHCTAYKAHFNVVGLRYQQISGLSSCFAPLIEVTTMWRYNKYCMLMKRFTIPDVAAD